MRGNVADGKTHMRWNVGAGVVMVAGTSVLAFLIPGSWHIVLNVLIGSIIGCFVNPDLDIDTSTHAKHILREIPVVGTTFVTAWTPYALNIGHRGPSHVWFLGSLGRIAYSYGIIAFLMVWVSGLFAIFGGDPMIPVNIVAETAASWSSLGLYAAWILQDCVHLYLDGIRPEF